MLAPLRAQASKSFGVLHIAFYRMFGDVLDSLRRCCHQSLYQVVGEFGERKIRVVLVMMVHSEEGHISL